MQDELSNANTISINISMIRLQGIAKLTQSEKENNLHGTVVPFLMPAERNDRSIIDGAGKEYCDTQSIMFITPASHNNWHAIL